MNSVVRCEAQCATSLQSIAEAQAAVQRAINRNDVVQAQQLLGDASRVLALGKQNLKRLEMATSGLVGTEKSCAISSFNNASKKLADLESKEVGLNTEIRRRDLFSSGGTSASSGNTANSFAGAAAWVQNSGDRDLLQQTMGSLERSNQYLGDSRQVLHETEAIGVNVLGNLGDQREMLIRANDKVKQTNSAASQARQALQRMSRRACYNKFVLWAIIVLLLTLIILVLFFKFLKK